MSLVTKYCNLFVIASSAIIIDNTLNWKCGKNILESKIPCIFLYKDTFKVRCMDKWKAATNVAYAASELAFAS